MLLITAEVREGKSAGVQDYVAAGAAGAFLPLRYLS